MPNKSDLENADNEYIDISTSKHKIRVKASVINDLVNVGLINSPHNSYHEGASNYSRKVIQPWHIWQDYPELNIWECDMIKRILRTKEGADPIEEYKKIIHMCNYLIQMKEQAMKY